MGKLFKWTFILFNLLMAVWLIGGMMGASEIVTSATSGAQKAGATIGTGIGALLILFLWVIGDILLGVFVFFTRPKG